MEPVELQQLEIEDPHVEQSLLVQQKTQEQDRTLTLQEEEQPGVNTKIIEQFEQKLQERINGQMKEETILAEQRRLDEQRVAQQKVLEEQRRKQLDRLNEQVQEKIERAILNDLLEQEKKKMLPIVPRVPKVMRRKKVKRRRPRIGIVKKVKKEVTPFTTFGNGQSRFGLGG